MFAPGFAFYHKIIDIDFYGSTDQRFEDLCHQPLISGSSILELKWHDLLPVQSARCYEGCLLFIWLEHGDLVVFGECIYEGEHFMSDSGVNYLIYLGQRKAILWANII